MPRSTACTTSRQLEARPDVELGGEADLEVADASSWQSSAQLEGRALQGLGVLQHRHRVAEALEVLRRSR